MTTQASKRDYSLLGESGRTAVETGLAAAEWYHTDVPRKDMKALMQRSDGPAIRDTAIWLGSMLALAAVGTYFWGTWICVPFFLAYGVLYGSASDIPLARMRPWHGLQDALDERCGLSDRLLHDHAQPGDLALEPHAPPHRYRHRRPRSRNRRHAAAGSVASRPQLLRYARRLARDDRHGAQRAGIISAEEKTFIPERNSPRPSASPASGSPSISRRLPVRLYWVRSCRWCLSACRASTVRGTTS
jgi:hypothetical protein